MVANIEIMLLLESWQKREDKNRYIIVRSMVVDFVVKLSYIYIVCLLRLQGVHVIKIYIVLSI